MIELTNDYAFLLGWTDFLRDLRFYTEVSEEERAIRALHWDAEESSNKAEDADNSYKHTVLLHTLAISRDSAGNDHSIAANGELSFGTGGRLVAVHYIHGWSQLNKGKRLILSYTSCQEPRIYASSFLADPRPEVVFRENSDSCPGSAIANAPWQFCTTSTKREWIEIFRRSGREDKAYLQRKGRI